VLSDVLGRAQAMTGRITALTVPALTGPAFPVRVVAGDNKTIHQALGQVPAGAVLVVDAGGYRDRAVWGEVMTIAAQQRGVAGLVLDGATRDVTAIRERGFPVFARGTSPAGPHKAGGGTIGAPICCGGVAVVAGDIVVADADGVTVVPAGRLAATWAAAQQRLLDEQGWIARIRSGESSASVLGIDDDTATPSDHRTKESQ
jgi:regulator of RNase E activity RraA